VKIYILQNKMLLNQNHMLTKLQNWGSWDFVLVLKA